MQPSDSTISNDRSLLVVDSAWFRRSTSYLQLQLETRVKRYVTPRNVTVLQNTTASSRFAPELRRQNCVVASTLQENKKNIAVSTSSSTAFLHPERIRLHLHASSSSRPGAQVTIPTQERSVWGRPLLNKYQLPSENYIHFELNIEVLHRSSNFIIFTATPDRG